MVCHCKNELLIHIRLCTKNGIPQRLMIFIIHDVLYFNPILHAITKLSHDLFCHISDDDDEFGNSCFLQIEYDMLDKASSLYFVQRLRNCFSIMIYSCAKARCENDSFHNWLIFGGDIYAFLILRRIMNQKISTSKRHVLSC